MKTPNYNGIVIITHGQQSSSLLDSVTHILGEAPSEIAALTLIGTERRSEIEEQGRCVVEELRQKCSGILILTDLYGSTQAIMAEKIACGDKCTACVHGVNLVMLLEAVALRQLPLKKLQQAVVNAGRQAIKTPDAKGQS